MLAAAVRAEASDASLLRFRFGFLWGLHFFLLQAALLKVDSTLSHPTISATACRPQVPASPILIVAIIGRMIIGKGAAGQGEVHGRGVRSDFAQLRGPVRARPNPTASNRSKRPRSSARTLPCGRARDHGPLVQNWYRWEFPCRHGEPSDPQPFPEPDI